ncbi:uncharacterized protein V1513DRAFT_204344 [Lipomyces chichibuensis]|uniref:uncharacterized protein n=1 Tax=Lipomyces chichibuensis TaxID=1546026 RepID=UPI003342F84D
MARLSRPSLAAVATQSQEDLDYDVQKWIDAARDSVAASPGQINAAIRQLLDGDMDRATMEAVLRALTADSMYLTSTAEEFNQLTNDLEAATKGTELLREALAQADVETDLARKEAEDAQKYANQAREATVSAGGFAAAEAVHPSKPREFKGTKFDGKSKNLDRFLNRLELDFRLYRDGFPTDEFKVAYAITGLGEKPAYWVQQFYRKDPKNVLKRWEAFRKELTDHYEDPDLLANQRACSTMEGTSWTTFLSSTQL